MTLAPAVAGCASVPRSDMQTLAIEVVTPTGTALGSGLGAGTADPHCACPAKLRVVPHPDNPPR